MQVIDEKPTVYFDIDNTLVLWNDKSSVSVVRVPDVDVEGKYYRLSIHQKHVQLLLRYHKQGYNIVVWSAAGSRWAANVIKALGLEEIVDLAISKPTRYVDDLDASEFMGKRYFEKNYVD